MDNLTHSLVGWALAETGLKRLTRKGTAACILAANMPDIDVLFGWAPWPPLAMHRGFTHGLVGGVLLMPPVLAGLLWLLDRWQQRRGGSSLPHWPMRFGWLIALCYMGALTHPLLDLQNVYAVELFSPLSDRWFHTDGLFIISPWLLVICGLGVAIARRRWNTGAHCAGRPARAAIAATIVFILINIGISRQAYAAVETDGPYARPDRIFASPEPIAFWRRDMVWRQQGAITHGRYDPLRHPTGLVEFSAAQPDYMDDPRVRRAAQSLDRRLQSFLAWSQMPMAQVVEDSSVVKVTFRDARFDAPSMRDRFAVSVSYPVKIRQ